MLPLPLGVPQVAGGVAVQVQLKPASAGGKVSTTCAPVTSLGPPLLTTMV